MPIYDYGCDKCGHEFHAEQRITDAPLKTCPECRSRKVRRLISRTSFVLKGSGWYSDLYSSAKPTADKGDSAKPESADKSADTPAAKPAAKSETGSEKTSGKGAKKGSKAAA